MNVLWKLGSKIVFCVKTVKPKLNIQENWHDILFRPQFPPFDQSTSFDLDNLKKYEEIFGENDAISLKYCITPKPSHFSHAP